MTNLTLKDQYELIRKRIEHGDNLVNHRLTWWLASQGALYAAFFSIWHASEPYRRSSLTLVGGVGVIISVFIIMSLTGHFKNVEMLMAFWRSRAGTTDRDGSTIDDFPHIAYSGRWWGSGAHVAALGMPTISIVLWVALASLIWLKA